MVGIVRRMYLTFVLTGVALVALLSTVQGQTSSNSTTRLPDGKPDLSGMWRNTSRDEGNLPAGPLILKEDEKGNFEQSFASRRCAPNQTGCRDNTNQTLDREFTFRFDPNRPLYKPEFWDKVQELDYDTNFKDPLFRCVPLGVPRMGPPVKIVQTKNEVIFMYAGQWHDYRIIPIDGRPHKADLFPTYYGDAVGHWEGDTLVIDIVGFVDDSWIASGIEGGGGGYFHSYDMHVIERLRREGNTIFYQATVEDPEVLVEPWTMNMQKLVLNPNPTATIEEGLPCHDYDEAVTVSRIRH